MIKPLAARLGLLLLLIVSLVASSAFAVPLSRGLRSVDGARIVPEYSAQNLRGFVERSGRRQLRAVHTDDYDDTGANNKHNPSTGGR